MGQGVSSHSRCTEGEYETLECHTRFTAAHMHRLAVCRH
jgi:hypothetical protein